jgi:serine/threonine protein kinase
MNVAIGPSEDVVPNVLLAEELGRGAFGSVRKGRHLTLDIDVAVKLVHSDAMSLDRAIGEARLLARIDHPNLLRVYDAGRSKRSLYMVLEYMDGGTLEVERSMPTERLLETTRQLLSGLQAMHDARILHRDVKPANCLRRADRVKLGDLGIATVLASQGPDELAGTLPFMAPELFESPPRYSAQSDLYALGITLACLALDRSPMPSVGGLMKVASWAREGERPEIGKLRPDLPPPLAELIQRLISPDRDVRPATAGVALASLAGEAPPQLPATLPASPDAMTRESGKRLGPWILGDVQCEWPNWTELSVTHLDGAPARLSLMRPSSPLTAMVRGILAAADRGARLTHPGILPVLDYGTNGGLPYVVTAPRGPSLQELVRGSGPMREVEALSIAADVADALAFLQSRGLVYQMVEPGAVLASKDGRSAQLGWPLYCVPRGTPARGTQ